MHRAELGPPRAELATAWALVAANDWEDGFLPDRLQSQTVCDGKLIMLFEGGFTSRELELHIRAQRQTSFNACVGVLHVPEEWNTWWTWGLHRGISLGVHMLSERDYMRIMVAFDLCEIDLQRFLSLLVAIATLVIYYGG